MSVVAVSNSRYLLGKGLGKQIDEFDDVVRFNTPPVAGYAADVGTKTTIWAFFTQRRGMDFDHFDCGRKLWWRPVHTRYEAAQPPGVEVMPPDLEHYLCAVIGLPKHTWPTTGMMTLGYLLREFETIHLAGWHKFTSFCSHYYSSKETRISCHRPKLEKRYIQSLMDEGRLVDIEDVT